MENAKKTFISGLNTDDSFFTHKPEDNLDALNVRVISSADGKSGSLAAVDGTRKIPTPTYGKGKIIGAYEDPTTNDIFYFYKNLILNEDYILCYKSKDETVYVVLRNSNLDQDYDLNFDKNKPITGISYIDGLLYFTGIDGREPWRINVDRGIKLNQPNYVSTQDAYITPIEKSVLTLIRKPPMLPLKITVQEDSERDTSFLKSRALTFSYRYIYKDGETSVFAPSTPHYPNQDIDDDNHKTSRKIKVDFPMFEAESYGICQDVQKIEFAVKFDSDTSYFVWKEFDRTNESTVFASQTFLSEGNITADFYNDVLGFAIDDANSIKLSDTVPFEAEALEIARNRLFLGNIKEGRINERKITSSDLSLQLVTDNFTNSFSQYERNRGGTVGFSHASAYQVGLAFYDFAGRTGGVLTDNSLKVITDERDSDMTTYNRSIDFTLNSSANSKIPDWAEYYSIVRTKNLIKDFTISNLSDKIRYFKYDSNGGFTVNVENEDNDGNPNGTFSDNELVTFNTEYEGIAIGLGDLTSVKKGYSYQEGDRIKLITDTTIIEAAITGQQGRYVLINLHDLNDSSYLGTSVLNSLDYTVVYEIYSPHKIQSNEFYYEAFNGRIIDNNGTKEFSNPTGSLIGDVYVKNYKADTSTLENHFHEGSQRSESASDEPIQGNADYIEPAIFYGVGLNDLSSNSGVGNYTHGDDLRYEIKIDSTTGSADTFVWRARSRSQYNTNTSYSSPVTITGNAQTLSYGVTVTFAATTGHTNNDRWVVSAKDATNPNMDDEPDRTYALYPPPPNGSILEGSNIKIYYREHRNPALSPSITHTWEYNSENENLTIDKTYISLEELFWETSFGLKLVQLNAGRWEKFSFRRGTMNNNNGGRNQLHILNSEANSGTATDVSLSDGTTIHMIIESREREIGGGRDVTNKYSITVDFSDEFDYKAESMNPSNDYFLNWTQISGRPNLVPKGVSSQIKTTGIVFSETKIPGSKINGLSKFSALDEDRLDDATGPLRLLTLTTKTQSTGTVLLAISENETTGIYLGEQQLEQTSSGGQFLSISKGVVGTKNSLQGSYGTLHPESVAVNEGNAYWFDVKNSTVVQYSTNGLVAIGDVKMKTYFKNKSDIIRNDLDKFVVGTYDDFNSEYIITLPQTEDVIITLQEDPYYPENPVIEVTNEATEPTTSTVNVSIRKPFFVSSSVVVIDGVATFTFTSQFNFTIPSNVVFAPQGEGITVTNASTGGFTQDSNGNYLAGTGSLTISNIFNVSSIILNLNQVVLPRTAATQFLLMTSYSSDFDFEFGPQNNGHTPVRIASSENPVADLGTQTISKTPSSGTLTVAATATVPWQIGTKNNNHSDSKNILEYDNNGGIRHISNSRVTTNATPITEGSGEGQTTIGYQPGSFNIVISDLDEDIYKVQFNSRPLRGPDITQNTQSNITTSGMTLNATLDSHEATVTSRGFVHSTTNTNPEIGGTGVTQVTVTGTTDGDISTDLTSLSAETTVYSKAFVITNFGTKYSAVSSTSTGAASNTAPTVTTGSYTSSTSSLSGTITANGGSTAGTNGITERGFVYSTSASTTTDLVIGGTGVTKKTASQFSISSFPYTFSVANNILLSGQTYYFRAYAKNDVGTSYGSVVSFTTTNTQVGIGGFTLQSSSVSSTGGQITIDVTKSTPSGAASGTVDFIFSSGNSIIDSDEDVAVAFTSSQTTDVIQVNIGANYGTTSRTINVKATGFSGIANLTGQSTPVTITGSITQAGGGIP